MKTVTADNCPPCNEAAAFLDEKGIEYTTYNISASDSDLKKFRRFRGRSLPLIIINNERIEGFNRNLLEIAMNNTPDTNTDSQKVVMYVTPRCGWCKRASSFFEKHGIDVIEYDIDASYENKEQFDSLGGRGTPLIYVGNIRIEGFSEKTVKAALKRVGLM